MQSKTALVFPGQGSQLIGMGMDFYDNFSVAKNVYHEVNDTLAFNLSELIFNGDISELNLTINAQPAIMTTSIAIYRVLMHEAGKQNITEICSVAAGHSLGEYSALCAADSITLGDTARLLKIRGNAMQEAVPVGQGAMSALLGVDIDGATALVTKASEHGICAIANDNCIGQIVISGHYEAIKYAESIAVEYGCKKAIRLPVSAPFHCPLMEPAAITMANAFSKVNIMSSSVPVVANYTAQLNNDSKNITNLLVKQISAMVRWRETIENMFTKQNIELFIEIGPGKVLSGLIKRIAPGAAKCMNVQNINDLENVLSVI